MKLNSLFWNARGYGILYLRQVTDQMITVKILFNTNVCFLTAAYAHCLYAHRRDLWTSLVALYPTITELWAWGGYFNLVRDLTERRGGGACPAVLP